MPPSKNAVPTQYPKIVANRFKWLLKHSLERASSAIIEEISFDDNVRSEPIFCHPLFVVECDGYCLRGTDRGGVTDGLKP